MKYTQATAKFNGITYENKERIGNVSVSIRNVQHPRKWGRWNANIRLTPSIHLDRQLYGTLHPHPDMPGQVMPDVESTRLMGLGNLKITIHTPIGAFAMSGGFGGTVSKIDDGNGLNTTTTREVRKLDLAWYAFFAKRFFILMGPRYYKESYETYQFALRIGVFWGAI